MGNKVLMNTGRPRPPNAGKGRRCGVPNVMPGAVKDMVLEALHAAGGVAYLTEQAHRQPAAFLVLLRKVLPRQATGQGTGAFVIQIVGGVPHSPARTPING